AHVVPGQPLLGQHLAAERLARQCLFLVHREKRDPADLVEIEVEALPPVIERPGQGRGLRLTPAGALGILDSGHVCSSMVIQARFSWARAVTSTSTTTSCSSPTGCSCFQAGLS